MARVVLLITEVIIIIINKNILHVLLPGPAY